MRDRPLCPHVRRCSTRSTTAYSLARTKPFIFTPLTPLDPISRKPYFALLTRTVKTTTRPMPSLARVVRGPQSSVCVENLAVPQHIEPCLYLPVPRVHYVVRSPFPMTSSKSRRLPRCSHHHRHCPCHRPPHRPKPAPGSISTHRRARDRTSSSGQLPTHEPRTTHRS